MRKVQTLFFDMNSYFASVWQAEEPSLRGRPVGVVTTLSAGAACIAASLEAKKTGVKVGTRTQEAQQLCPDIVFRPALHDMFVSYHHRIKAAVDTVLPIDKTHSVDEFSCRLMGTQQDLDTALQIGRDLQAAILTQVSPALRSSVGVAPNKLLAKIAAELEKPMGLNWLLPEVLPDRISHLRCDQLPGISKGMLRRLDAAGIVDIPMLYHLPPKQARHIWRSVEGERFVRQLRGETVVPPPIKHSSLGHGQQLTAPNRSPRAARLVARRLLIKAASRLRRENGCAQALSISVKCKIHGRQSAGGALQATQDTFQLLRIFNAFWDTMNITAPFSVAVMLSDLVAKPDRIPDLFAAQTSAGMDAREDLCLQIDKLNQKFGQNTIRFGELPPHHVPFTGAKIAFGRVPDKEDFRE